MQTESVLSLIEHIEQLDAELRLAHRDAEMAARKRWLAEILAREAAK